MRLNRLHCGASPRILCGLGRLLPCLTHSVSKGLKFVTKNDAVVLKQFALLVMALAAFALLLIILAHTMNNRFYGYGAAASGTPLEELNSTQRERVAAYRSAVDARLAPVGSVNAGETGRAAMMAAEEAARKAMSGKVAYDGTLDGAVIYQNLCSACHQSGAGGAPLPNKETWAPRIAQGLDTLVKHATEGFQGQAGMMPARGGNPALSDEQVRVTVEHMVSEFK